MNYVVLSLCFILFSSPALAAPDKAAQTEQIFEAIRNYEDFPTETVIIQALTKATSAGGELNARNDRGVTPLLVAGDRGLPKVMEWLVNHGADVNKATLVNPQEKQGGISPLFLATQQLPLATIQFLVDHGAKVGAKTADGYSVLSQALRFHRNDIAAYLLDKGAPLEGQKKIFLYAQIGHMPGVIKEWQAGVSHKAKNPEGETLLHLAAAHGHLDLAKELLDRKADVNIKDATGHTPLWFAVTSEENPKGKAALLDLLADRGGNLQVRFAKGKTLLHAAAGVGAARVDIELFVTQIQWLIKRGVPADARDESGRSAAYLAAAAHNYPIAKVLVDATPGLDRNELGGIATEALGDEDWLHLLIEKKKANVNARGEDGKTLLHKAAINDDIQLSQYLLDHGADPTLLDDFKSTWLDQPFAGSEVRKHFQAKQ